MFLSRDSVRKRYKDAFMSPMSFVRLIYGKKLLERDPSRALDLIIKILGVRPQVLEIPVYETLSSLVLRLGKQAVAERFEQGVSQAKNSPSPYLAYGSYLYHVLGDVRHAKEMFLKGMALSPDLDSFAISLYRIAVLEGRTDEAEALSAGFKKPSPVVKRLLSRYEPFCFIEPMLPSRTLETVIGGFHSAQPRIIDASKCDFTQQRKSNSPLIALFAYAMPLPNLDVMYYFYNLLKKQGKNVVLFVHSRNLKRGGFDFSEIEIKDGDEFYSASPGFFEKSVGIDCIITNDMAGINCEKLPEGCSLVYHAPHNMNSPTIDEFKFGAHYSTYLVGGDVPSVTDEAKQLARLDRHCFIPNYYTKNEYLFEFLNAFDRDAKVISYCPTWMWDSIDAMRECDDFHEAFHRYIDSVVEMVQGILDRFPEYYFVYRPFLGDPIHWCVSRRLIEGFDQERRFVFDAFANSKYVLALSDVLITDKSGIGVTYAEMKGVKHIGFDPGGVLKCNPEWGLQCESVHDVFDAITALLEKRTGSTEERVASGRNELYGAISYLVNNIDYILEDRIHPEWHYLEFS